MAKQVFRIRIKPELFCKKGALKNFAKFAGKHLWRNVFLIKVAGPRSIILLKKRLLRNYPAKFLRTPFLQNNAGGIVLAGYNDMPFLT